MIKMDFSQHLNLGKPVKMVTTGKSPLLPILLVLLLSAGGFFYYSEMLEKPTEKVVMVKDEKKANLKKPLPPVKASEALPETASEKLVVKESLPEKVAPKEVYKGPKVPINITESNKELSRFLSKLFRETPRGVSFASLAIQSPEYFYVRGIAETASLHKRFQKVLKSSVKKITKVTVKKLGAAKIARDFVTYGRLKKVNSKLTDVPLTKVSQRGELKKFKDLFFKTTKTRINLKEVGSKKYPVSKRFDYEFSQDMKFTKLKEVISKISSSNLKVYVSVVRLEAGENENMIASFRISVFGEG